LQSPRNHTSSVIDMDSIYVVIDKIDFVLILDWLGLTSHQL